VRVEGNGIKITVKDRKKRSDSKVKISPYVDKETFDLANTLARCTDMSTPSLFVEIAFHMLRNPTFVNWYMDYKKVTKNDPFRITPAVVDGKMKYILKGED
jgi:hypothetical protein